MRWSEYFTPTLRDVPAEADAPSHKLLLRAGFIRQLMSGHYTLLPLAQRARLKVIQIIREEMEAIGAQEFLTPAVHPAEVWQQSGRWELMGDEMFRLKDRKDQDLALGMTHEEVFTTIFSEVQSYRDLPQSWYQFQTKFRDEPRPKSGLLRLREFTMKDSYSFDIDQDSLDQSFDKHRAAYVKAFSRLGIRAIPVDASNGAMGGSGSTEFQAPADIGEDVIVHCPADGYASNIESAESNIAKTQGGTKLDSPERFDTPGVRTIADLEQFAGGATADAQIKTLVFMADGEPVLALLRGDHELVEQRLIDATKANELRPATPEEIKPLLGANAGSLGAVGVKGIKIIADSSLQGAQGMTTGANIDDVHLRGVDVDRDINTEQFVTLRRVRSGEPCPQCGAELEEIRTIEVGHIFKLGDKYTKAFKTTVLDKNGKAVTPIMGSYGIGVDRAMAVIVETNHDDKGIIWPVAVAPFAVCVSRLANDETTSSVADTLYQSLKQARVETIFDDRDDRPGAKLADAELIGFPIRAVVGKRSAANNKVEITIRRTGVTTEVDASDAVAFIQDSLNELSNSERA